MEWVLITYDVDKSHDTEMKNELKDKGYRDNLKCGDTKIILPNTTLCKNRINCNIGLNDMKTIADKIHAILERAIAVEFNKCKGISGKPYSS
jgi:hypothetical protein